MSKGHSLRAADKTDELKQLNRSIFRPVITFNKDKKRAAQEAKIQERYEDERENREKAMRDIRDTQDRLGRAATYGMRDEDDGEGIGGPGAGGSGRFRTAAQLQQRKDQRKRYQFEADEEDDALEDELDDNLDEIMDVTKRLKALGSAMSSELDSQNDRITRITDKTDGLDAHLFKNTQRVSGSVVCIVPALLIVSRSLSTAQPDQVEALREFGRHGPSDGPNSRTLALFGRFLTICNSERLWIHAGMDTAFGGVQHRTHSEWGISLYESSAKPTAFFSNENIE